MPSGAKRRWAADRVALGQAQMAGAVSITVACLAASLILCGKGDRAG
jgi:hypothetical protein